MMLRLALRLHRTGLLACSALGALNGVAQATGFKGLAGNTPEARLQFGTQMAVVGKQLVYLLPLPVHPETMAGFVQWRVYGFMPTIFAAWALLSATGAIRGEEERGLLEIWLSAGISRARLIAERLTSFTIVAAIAVATTGLGCALVMAAAESSPPVGGLLGESAALLALSVACCGLSLLVAQLAGTRRAAAAWGGALLVALYLLNSQNRTAARPSAFRWLSPFYYYDRSDAVAPGGHLDLPATVGLLAAALLLTAVAVVAFVRRDLGAPLFGRRAASRSPLHLPARNPLLRLPVLPSLYEQRAGIAAWAVGTGLGAVFFVSLAKQVVEPLRKLPSLHAYLSALGSGNLDQAFVGFFWFSILQLALAVYAITQVSRWSSDDAEGRLEMMLSAPIRRWQVVIERALGLTLATGLIILVGAVAALAVSPAIHLALNQGDLLRASLPLLPFGLSFGAVGAFLAGSRPRAAVTALSTYAVASYLLQQFGPLFKWPSWFTNLSVFQLYGTPLSTGVNWSGLWVMVAITLAGFGGAILTMERREIGR